MKQITDFDTRVLLWFGQFTHEGNCQLIKYISKTGDGYLYVALGCLLFIFDAQHGSVFFYTALMSYALEVPLYLCLKTYFKRPRPSNFLFNYKALITPSDKFSLPSGHTAAAFLMASIVAFFYPTFAVVAFTWASLVGLSRILLGVHFPSDVLLGAALGSTIAAVSIMVLA